LNFEKKLFLNQFFLIYYIFRPANATDSATNATNTEKVNVTIGGGEDAKPIPLEDSLFADFNIDQLEDPDERGEPEEKGEKIN
jgi:hypothetical protein